MRSDPEVRNGVQQAQQQAFMQSDKVQEKLSRTTRRSRVHRHREGGGGVGKMNDDV